jgi:NADH-quinone oxidoreductase subunit A
MLFYKDCLACLNKESNTCFKSYHACLKNNNYSNECVQTYFDCMGSPYMCDNVFKHQAELMLVSERSIVKQDYTILLISLIVAALLAVVILTASYILSRQNPDSEKLSPYECGFEPYDDTRHTFDIKFCLVAVLFIIFDIEIMFLIPWCVSISKLSLLGFWSMIDFLIELAIGFFYVWYVKALNWD